MTTSPCRKCEHPHPPPPHTPIGSPVGPQWDLTIALLLFFNPSPLYTLLRAHTKFFPCIHELLHVLDTQPPPSLLEVSSSRTNNNNATRYHRFIAYTTKKKESSPHRALTQPAHLLFTQPQRPLPPAPWPQTLAHWARCPHRCLPPRRCPGVPPWSCPRLASLGPPLMQQPGMGQHPQRGSGRPPRIEWCLEAQRRGGVRTGAGVSG